MAGKKENQKKAKDAGQAKSHIATGLRVSSDSPLVKRKDQTSPCVSRSVLSNRTLCDDGDIL